MKITATIATRIRKDGTFPIRFDLYDHSTGERARISSDYTIRKADWNQREHRPKDESFSQLVDLEKRKLWELFQQHQRVPVVAKHYKKKEQVLYLGGYGRWLADHHPVSRTGGSYRSALNSFAKVHPKVALRDITRALVVKWMNHERERGISNTTIRSYMGALGAIYSAARDTGEPLDHINPFANRPPKDPVKRQKHVLLKDLQSFVHAEFGNPYWSRTQDIFTLCLLFRGMALVDLVNLTEHNLVNSGTHIHLKTRVKNRRKASNAPMTIWISPRADDILSRYRTGNNYLLNFVEGDTEEKKYFHKYQAFMGRYNEYLKDISADLNINPKMTGYSARFTFANLAEESLPSYRAIKIMMGHSMRSDVTEGYLQSAEQQRVDEWHRIVLKKIFGSDRF